MRCPGGPSTNFCLSSSPCRCHFDDLQRRAIILMPDAPRTAIQAEERDGIVVVSLTRRFVLSLASHHGRAGVGPGKRGWRVFEVTGHPA